MQKLRHLRLGIVLLALYCLLFAGAAAIRIYPPGQWGHATLYSKGLSMPKELPMIVKRDQTYLVQNSNSLNQHATQPAKIIQVQLLTRQKEIAAKESKRRRRKRELKRVSHKLHEVPSGPNPISNEIPTKLVDAQNIPNSMP